MLERKQEEERKQYIQTGVIAAAVINFSMCHPDQMVDPMEFVPGGRPEVDISKLPPEEQAARVMSSFSKRTVSK